MSWTERHQADCSEVLAAVWLYLDQECDCERRELLQHHLDECGPCLEQYGIEEQLKALLARKCGGEQAPVELRQRLREAIQALMMGAAEEKARRDGSGAVERVETGARLESGERLVERGG